MKAEFLQNLKVGNQSLTGEVVDAILAENQRDVEAAQKGSAAPKSPLPTMSPSRSSWPPPGRA